MTTVTTNTATNNTATARRTTTTDRFDPREGVAYGQCTDCDIVLETRADVDEHLSQTRQAFASRRSHRIRVSNPERSRRIDRAVSRIVEEHLNDALDEVRELVRAGHLTADEAEQALPHCADAQQMWRDQDPD